MPDLMAIISKAVFEKAAGKAPKVGAQLAMDRYVSANKNLEPLTAGGKLYLVTVRPPDEALWLVAVLDHPHFDGTQWIAAPSPTPITDISALRAQIKFESGKGMSLAPGALGMSLQTPRALTAADLALLDGAVGGGKSPPVPGALAQGVPPPPAAAAATTDRAAELLAAVLADPDSDIARQVYADELATRNDARGEFISIDLALAGPLSIRKRDHLLARRGELIAHAKDWWPWSLKTRVHRGFVEAVTATADQLKGKVATELFAKEPVVELVVDGVEGKPGVTKLVRAPWMSRVRRLRITGLDDEAFAALVAAAACQQLESLNVTSPESELSAEATASLKSHLPACRTLSLSAIAIGDEGIAGLRAWKHLARVQTLYLSQCGLSTAGVTELISAPLPALAKLSLTNNELDDEIAASFATHAKNLPALRVLELKNAGLSHAVVETFQHSKLALARLDLRRNGVRYRQVEDIPYIRAR